MKNFKCCPRCGQVYGEYLVYDEIYCHDCLSSLSFLEKRAIKPNVKLIQTDILYEDWPRKEGEPETADFMTQSMYEFFWEHYIDVPENDKLDRALFEARKAALMSTFEKGGVNHKILPPRPSQQPKDASVIGRGVAGGLVAGPVGAIIGAASALDKNAKNRSK